MTVKIVTTLQMTKMIFNRLAADALIELIFISMTSKRKDVSINQKYNKHTNGEDSSHLDNCF
jgi:hypothetical protein